ncbi:MAG: hypothetical protein E7004_04960 [Alphaproteobacteria bacterium]|nr:hypothetical protein [Alphaproteobacteria bacterium]
MKYIIDAHEFSFNKIKNGSRKIAIHLFDKNAQKIKINDILEIRNISNKESLECIVKGLAIFDNFNDLTDSLTPQALGYKNKEEVLIRINRMFSKELQQNLNSVAFFLEPRYERVNFIERGEYER